MADNIKNKAGTGIGNQYVLLAKQPIDARYVVKSIAERDSIISEGAGYPGLTVWVEATKEKYEWNGTAWCDAGSVTGTKVGTGTGNVVTSITLDSNTKELKYNKEFEAAGKKDLDDYILKTEKGKANGIATLDASGNLDLNNNSITNCSQITAANKIVTSKIEPLDTSATYSMVEIDSYLHVTRGIWGNTTNSYKPGVCIGPYLTVSDHEGTGGFVRTHEIVTNKITPVADSGFFCSVKTPYLKSNAEMLAARMWITTNDGFRDLSIKGSGVEVSQDSSHDSYSGAITIFRDSASSGSRPIRDTVDMYLDSTGFCLYEDSSYNNNSCLYKFIRGKSEGGIVATREWSNNKLSGKVNVDATNSSKDASAQYNAGISLIADGSNCPGSSQYGALLTLPYRTAYDNTSPDFAGQIFIPNGDASPDLMYYRTSKSSVWDNWQTVASRNWVNTQIAGKLNTSGGNMSGHLVIGNNSTTTSYLQICSWNGYGSGHNNIWYSANNGRTYLQGGTDSAIVTDSILNTRLTVTFGGAVQIGKGKLPSEGLWLLRHSWEGIFHYYIIYWDGGARQFSSASSGGSGQTIMFGVEGNGTLHIYISGKQKDGGYVSFYKMAG